jgi:hypothetical protein
MRLTTRELIEHARRTVADQEQQKLASMRREVLAAMLQITARERADVSAMRNEIFWYYDVPQRVREPGMQRSFRDVAHAFWDQLELLVERDELIVALAKADAAEVDLSTFVRALQTFLPLRERAREWREAHSEGPACEQRNSRSCWLYRHLGPAWTWESESSQASAVSCEDLAAHELFRRPLRARNTDSGPLAQREAGLLPPRERDRR